MGEHARLTVVECDVEIARAYAFEGAIAEVAGRGGTDLRPVFAEDFLGTRKVDGVDLLHRRGGAIPRRGAARAGAVGADEAGGIRLSVGGAGAAGEEMTGF